MTADDRVPAGGVCGGEADLREVDPGEGHHRRGQVGQEAADLRSRPVITEHHDRVGLREGSRHFGRDLPPQQEMKTERGNTLSNESI